MDQAKVIEMLNQTQMTEYIKILMNAKFKKLVLFPVFPITAAANVSDPKYFVMLGDLTSFLVFKKPDLN
jgi:hypothetical protein